MGAHRLRIRLRQPLVLTWPLQTLSSEPSTQAKGGPVTGEQTPRTTQARASNELNQATNQSSGRKRKEN